MDLIFNELSLHHNADNQFEATKQMENLLQTCKKARKASNGFNFNRLRVHDNFFNVHLSEDYTISDWLNDDSINRNLKSLLLGLKRYPFIAETDQDIETRFIENYYYLNAPEIESLHRKLVEGLAVAFLYNTLSISLKTHTIWNKTEIDLAEKIEDEEKSVKVRHISQPDHIESHQNWIDDNRPVELLETEVLLEEKTINLRDDHGKDILKHFADKLISSPYVIKVINSLPFNPKEKNFVRRIYPDGKIEVVLTWTDEGFGLIFQTTGRNLQEAREIGSLIEEKYGKSS
jgi:hypothetical protein